MGEQAEARTAVTIDWGIASRAAIERDGVSVTYTRRGALESETITGRLSTGDSVSDRDRGISARLLVMQDSLSGAPSKQDTVAIDGTTYIVADIRNGGRSGSVTLYLRLA